MVVILILGVLLVLVTLIPVYFAADEMGKCNKELDKCDEVLDKLARKSKD